MIRFAKMDETHPDVEQPDGVCPRHVVRPLQQGDAAVITVPHRPAQGARGVYRVDLRRGVRRVRAGQRHTLGVIFHDVG